MKIQKRNKIISGYKVLNIQEDTIYAAKGYRIFSSKDNGKNWELDGQIEDFKYAIFANSSRLLARLFRAEITDLLVLEDGTRLAIAKKGIFVAKFDEKIYQKTFKVPRGSRPLKLCLDGNGIIYFGEYFRNPQRLPVHIYRSMDKGLNWDICYTFPEKSIRHVHGIFYDHYQDLIWFTTGDFDSECIIGNTSDDFKTINIFKKGTQIYRTVALLFYKDFIVYGTDTEYEINYIYRIDRIDGKEYKLEEIQGSVFSAVQVGERSAIATAVEPSEINLDNFSHVWFSMDGLVWKELFKYEKDEFNSRYFQVGKIKFPNGAIHDEKLFSTGHSLKAVDNSTIVTNYKEELL